MKKLIPLVLGVWVIALVGCTTTTTTTPSTTSTTTTTTRKGPSASLDPTTANSRSAPMPVSGPR